MNKKTHKNNAITTQTEDKYKQRKIERNTHNPVKTNKQTKLHPYIKQTQTQTQK